jgi:hypothetical protein
LLFVVVRWFCRRALYDRDFRSCIPLSTAASARSCCDFRDADGSARAAIE